MKKIELKPYDIDIIENGETVKRPFPVKESLVNILLSADLKLNGRELLLAHKFAEKIEACQEDSILVEYIDYQRLTKAIDQLTGFNKAHVELVRRIVEAPEVQVQEK